jgi:predicted  nucleic acid-binding Zn-ribbon protein
MDMTRLETLETHVVTLVEAYVRIKEENKKLCQDVRQLRETLRVQREDLARLQPEQDEMARLRTLLQSFHQEREIIRQKLEQMLAIIESLEGEARLGEDTEP